MSPLFFNMYADVLIVGLEKSDLGCHVGSIYIGCIAYADDIILISGSVAVSQKMLDICVNYGNVLDIVFNAKKSCLFKVGPMHQSEVKNLILGDNDIEWATGLRYLGVLFTSAKMLTVDMSMQTRKFYAASNSILHNSIYVSEMSRLHLIEA